MRFDRSLYGGTTNFGRRRHKDLQGAKIRFRGTEYKRKDATSVNFNSFYFSYLLQLETDFGLVNKHLYKRIKTSSIFGSTSDWPIEPLIHRKLGEASLLHPTRWKPSLLDPTGQETPTTRFTPTSISGNNRTSLRGTTTRNQRSVNQELVTTVDPAKNRSSLTSRTSTSLHRYNSEKQFSNTIT